MKVLTIKHPFASLIAEGIKEYEFRTWKTKYRGDILIHAGKSIDKEAMKKYEHLNLSYPTGCIIAKVKLVKCLLVDDEVRKVLKLNNSIIYSHVINDTDWIGYAFKLENVSKIGPIEINGKLGFWEYDYQGKKNLR